MKLPSQIIVNSVSSSEIPSRPGVYLFYDRDDVLLYVGKSIDVRSRVNNHFSSPTLNNRRVDIRSQIHKIEVFETVTDLTAQLLELHLIKTKLPLYNRKSRRTRGLTVVRFSPSAEKLVIIHKSTQTIPTDSDDQTVLFRSIRHATAWLERAVAELGLCPGRLGLESTTSGACFSYQLGRCRGVCAGHESHVDHDSRLLDRVKSYQFISWPPDNQLTISADNSVMAESVTIDNWQLQSINLKYDNFAYHVEASKINFDYDSYRLLSADQRIADELDQSINSLAVTD